MRSSEDTRCSGRGSKWKTGEPVQVIDEWEPRRLEVEDLTGLTREEREEEVRRIAREEAETGFDLSRGPLLRVKVLKLEEEEHVVLFTMHHIVSDGWSMGILIREVGALYQAYQRGRGVAAGGVADPVRRFRGLAERVAEGRGAGEGA